MKRFLTLLSISLLLLSVNGCRRYINYPTIIRVIAGEDGFDGQFSVVEEGSGVEFFAHATSAFVGPGETVTIEILWDDAGYENWNPRFNKMVVHYQEYRSSYVPGIDGYETVKSSDPVKIKPGKIYEWDYENSSSLEDTGERTEKIENPGGGGCGDEVGYWTLSTINGSPLPYRLEDGVSDVVSGWITYNSDGTWEGENHVEGTVNGQFIEKTNYNEGVYECEDGVSTALNTNNSKQGTITVDGNELFLDDVNGNDIIFTK